MSQKDKPNVTSEEPWPENYPNWLIELLEHSMGETGMSRKEAEEFLQFELLFGGNLMWQYAEKAKAHQKETKKSGA